MSRESFAYIEFAGIGKILFQVALSGEQEKNVPVVRKSSMNVNMSVGLLVTGRREENSEVTSLKDCV